MTHNNQQATNNQNSLSIIMKRLPHDQKLVKPWSSIFYAGVTFISSLLFSYPSFSANEIRIGEITPFPINSTIHDVFDKQINFSDGEEMVGGISTRNMATCASANLSEPKQWSSDGKFFGYPIATDVLFNFVGGNNTTIAAKIRLGVSPQPFNFKSNWNSNGTNTTTAENITTCKNYEYMFLAIDPPKSPILPTVISDSTLSGTIYIYAGPNAEIGSLTSELLHAVSLEYQQIIPALTVSRSIRTCTMNITPDNIDFGVFEQRSTFKTLKTISSELSINCVDGVPTDPVSVDITFNGSNSFVDQRMYLHNNNGKKVGLLGLTSTTLDMGGSNNLDLRGTKKYKLTGTNWSNLTSTLDWQLTTNPNSEPSFLGVGTGSVKITVDWP